jgi:hypothetical protein
VARVLGTRTVAGAPLAERVQVVQAVQDAVLGDAEVDQARDLVDPGPAQPAYGLDAVVDLNSAKVLPHSCANRLKSTGSSRPDGRPASSAPSTR